MKIITEQQIQSLHITPQQAIEWVQEAFRMKYEADLPPKISVHPKGDDFITTMPCLLPEKYNRFGVKIVSRNKGRNPALHSDLLLYEVSSSKLLALMNSDFITQMRTGAVAALSAKLFGRKNAKNYAFVGLGNVAYASMQCLLTTLNPNKTYNCKLLKYKDQAEKFACQFKDSPFCFEIVDSPEELIENTDILISAVTSMPDLFCNNNKMYKEGVLLIPIHTRGFQNCDLFFDHIFGDDTAHICKFKYFNQFKKFDELSEVLLGKIQARQNDKERIICYNIGIGLHDVWFAHRIYNMLGENA